MIYFVESWTWLMSMFQVEWECEGICLCVFWCLVVWLLELIFVPFIRPSNFFIYGTLSTFQILFQKNPKPECEEFSSSLIFFNLDNRTIITFPLQKTYMHFFNFSWFFNEVQYIQLHISYYKIPFSKSLITSEMAENGLPKIGGARL